MKHVLAYQPPGTSELKKFDIPEGYEDKIDQVISQNKKVTIKGETLMPEDICGIFTEEEYQSLKASGLVSPQPKTWDEVRQQEWYLRSKRAVTGKGKR